MLLMNDIDVISRCKFLEGLFFFVIVPSYRGAEPVTHRPSSSLNDTRDILCFKPFCLPQLRPQEEAAWTLSPPASPSANKRSTVDLLYYQYSLKAI